MAIQYFSFPKTKKKNHRSLKTLKPTTATTTATATSTSTAVTISTNLRRKKKEWKPSEKKRTQAQNFAIMFATSWMRWGLGRRGWAKGMKCDMLGFGNGEEFL